MIQHATTQNHATNLFDSAPAETSSAVIDGGRQVQPNEVLATLGRSPLLSEVRAIPVTLMGNQFYRPVFRCGRCRKRAEAYAAWRCVIVEAAETIPCDGYFCCCACAEEAGAEALIAMNKRETR